MRSTAASARHLFLVGPGRGQGIVDLDRPDYRAPRGMASPARRSGYPLPSQRSWWLRTKPMTSFEMDQRRQDLRSHRHVLLDVLVLFLGERPLLVEDLLPDADLADVVQPAPGADRLDLLVGEPDSAATIAERSATRAE